MRVKKFLSAKCPVWSGICLSCGRRCRLYCCDAFDRGGSSSRSIWLGLLLILLNNRSSPSSTSWTKSGRSVEQYPLRLLRRKNASVRCLSALVMNPNHADAAYVSRDGRSRVRPPVYALPRNNLGKLFYMHVPLSTKQYKLVPASAGT